MAARDRAIGLNCSDTHYSTYTCAIRTWDWQPRWWWWHWWRWRRWYWGWSWRSWQQRSWCRLFVCLFVCYWLTKYPLFAPSLAKLGIFPPTKNSCLLNQLLHFTLQHSAKGSNTWPSDSHQNTMTTQPMQPLWLWSWSSWGVIGTWLRIKTYDRGFKPPAMPAIFQPQIAKELTSHAQSGLK